MTVGKNTLRGKELHEFIERIELLEKDKKQISNEIAEVKASAKSAGFDTKIMSLVIRRRAMRPHDLQEGEALLELYEHAMGSLPEPPLFRAVGLAATDELARETIIERAKTMVPIGGEIILKLGGVPVRIWREKDGEAQAADYVERKSANPAGGGAPKVLSEKRAPVPDCSPVEAFDLGKVAAKNNQPVIDNPFPFGDPRRARWDEGWRKETGSDGMGPDD
jgi:uncharacterized protein (UPF0335 family)